MAEYGIKQMWPDEVTDYSATAKNGIGVLRFEGDKVYRYIKTHSDLTGDALAVRNVVSLITEATANTPDWIVTNKSAGVVTGAGVAVSVIPESYYGWIQVGGIANVVGDGSVAFGEAVVPNGDGTVDTMAAGEEHEVIGFAVTDDVATTYYVDIKLKGLI